LPIEHTHHFFDKRYKRDFEKSNFGDIFEDNVGQEEEWGKDLGRGLEKGCFVVGNEDPLNRNTEMIKKVFELFLGERIEVAASIILSGSDFRNHQ